MGRPGKALAAALIAAALCAAATPAGATAAPKGFYGVSAAVPPAAADYGRMKSGGADMARVQFYWASVEPQAGARNWAATDAIVASAAAAGIDLLPLFASSPAWLAGTPARPPIYSASQRGAWTSFMRDFALRYGPGGTFWTLRPDLPPRPIRAVQAWNEPNLGFFWGSKPNPKRYAQLVNITASAVHSVQPSWAIVSGGIFPRDAVGNNISAAKFIRGLFSVKSARSDIDAFGVHPYGTSPRAVLDETRGVRRLLNRSGAKRIPMWATEFGWTTGGAGWKKSPFRATPKQQARRLRLAYSLLGRSAGRLKLRRAFWFSWRDFDSAGRDFWTARSGLFTLAGSPKPAWKAYAQAAGGRP